MDEYLIHLRWRVEEVRTMAEKTTAASDGMPHATGTSDKVGNAAVKLVELEAQLRDLEQAFIEYRTEVQMKITELPEIEYKILKLRYINYEKWDDIADAVGYVTRSVQNIKLKAFRDLQELLDAG